MSEDMFGDELPGDVLEHLQTPEIRAKWPKALADLVTVIESANGRAGDDQDAARDRAVIIVRALSKYAGGRQLYIPKDDVLERALRDREIWNRFQGNNVDELASTYKLTAVKVYSIIAEQRLLHRQKVQPSLL